MDEKSWLEKKIAKRWHRLGKISLIFVGLALLLFLGWLCGYMWESFFESPHPGRLWVSPLIETQAPTSNTVVSDILKNDAEDVKVFVTPTGQRYHREGCRHLSQRKTETTLDTATERGLTPCSVCKPPEG